MNARGPRLTEMESALTTDPELDDILAELSRRKPMFHRPAFGSTRADFEKMAAEDFLETSEFQCRNLGEESFLLTCTHLRSHVRLARLPSIWRKTADGWKIVYHQGTEAQDFATA